MSEDSTATPPPPQIALGINYAGEGVFVKPNSLGHLQMLLAPGAGAARLKQLAEPGAITPAAVRESQEPNGTGGLSV